MYAASLMGFKKLIGGMYPIIGWLGVALLVVLAVGWLRERVPARKASEPCDGPVPSMPRTAAASASPPPIAR